MSHIARESGLRPGHKSQKDDPSDGGHIVGRAIAGSYEIPHPREVSPGAEWEFGQ